MNWKKFILSSCVALAVIAMFAGTAQAQSQGRSGGGGRGGSAGSMHNGGRNWHNGGGNWNHGGGNWNHGGHGWHNHNHFYGGFYPYGYGFYPYWWGYGYPYYGAYYYNGYGDGRVYDGRAVGSGGGSVVANVQQELARAGYYHGSIDGVIGNQTRSAIRAYERRNGLRVDGRIDDELLDSMDRS